MGKLSTELANRLFDYIISDPTYVEDVKKNFKITGYVYSADLLGNQIPGTPKYAFVGNGCGITYLKFDKRSRKAIELDVVVREVRRECENFLYHTFTDDEIDYFQKIGSPVMAVLQQDQVIQQEFYSRVVKFAKDILGVQKISYVSMLD